MPNNSPSGWSKNNNSQNPNWGNNQKNTPTSKPNWDKKPSSSPNSTPPYKNKTTKNDIPTPPLTNFNDQPQDETSKKTSTANKIENPAPTPIPAVTISETYEEIPFEIPQPHSLPKSTTHTMTDYTPTPTQARKFTENYSKNYTENYETTPLTTYAVTPTAPPKKKKSAKNPQPTPAYPQQIIIKQNSNTGILIIMFILLLAVIAFLVYYVLTNEKDNKPASVSGIYPYYSTSSKTPITIPTEKNSSYDFEQTSKQTTSKTSTPYTIRSLPTTTPTTKTTTTTTTRTTPPQTAPPSNINTGTKTEDFFYGTWLHVDYNDVNGEDSELMGFSFFEDGTFQRFSAAGGFYLKTENGTWSLNNDTIEIVYYSGEDYTTTPTKFTFGSETFLLHSNDYAPNGSPVYRMQAYSRYSRGYYQYDKAYSFDSILVTSDEDYLNIRREPNSDILYEIPNGATIKVSIEYSNVDKRGYCWFRAEYREPNLNPKANGVCGYVYSKYLNNAYLYAKPDGTNGAYSNEEEMYNFYS
jgi:hypothetical protein